MKRVFMPMLIVLLLALSGCGSGDSGGADLQAVANSLAIEAGYERHAEEMTLSGFSGEISAASLYDNKLWFVSGQVLYSANSECSDILAVFGSIPEGAENIAFGADGDIYFGYTHDVRVFSKNGAEISRISLELTHALFDLVTSPDGVPVALVMTEQGYKVYAVTRESFGDEIDYGFPANIDIRGICFYRDAVFLSISDGLSAYSEDDEFSVFKWSDIGVASIGGYVAGITEKGDIIYLNRDAGSLYLIQSVPALFEKTELRLAVVTDTGRVATELETAVAEFNASSNEYNVNIVKYDSIDQLNLQIIAGKIPDLIEIPYIFPFKSAASKGLFEDLAPYFDNDPEVALLPAARRTLCNGEKLFMVSPGFVVMTLIGSADFVGAEQGWTFDEMKQYLADAPEGSTVFSPSAGWTKENILLFLLYQNMDEYIDWVSGRALYDGQDFKDLLEFVNSTSTNPQDTQDEIERILESRQLIMHYTIFEPAFFVRIERYFQYKAVYKGFPGSLKCSGVLYPAPYTLAVTTSCADKDGAWQFVRSALLIDDDSQDIPIVQSKFDLAIQSAMTEGKYGEKPMTQAQYEKFLNFIDGVSSVTSGNLSLQMIIEEEVPAYFAGQKSLDEVCGIIQSRAQTYVNEQSNYNQ